MRRERKTDEERWALGLSLQPDERRYVLELFAESRAMLKLSPEQWLGQVEFLVKKDGNLDLRKRYCRLPAVPGEPDRRFHRAPRYQPLPEPPKRQQGPHGVRPIIEEALATGDLVKANEDLHRLSGGKSIRQVAEEWAGQIQPPAEPEVRNVAYLRDDQLEAWDVPAAYARIAEENRQREQQQQQQQQQPDLPSPPRPIEGQTYSQRVWMAYQALADEMQTPDVPIHAIHGRVGGSINELHALLRAESLAHRAVATTGEPTLAGHAARQSALRLPGESETFLNIKLIEPPIMNEPQQQTAAPPELGRRLSRNDLDVIIEALEYRCEAIEGGTGFGETARLKSIVPTLEKLRALEAQPQRPEHERYESLLRATAALRYPAEERTAEMEVRIEKTIARKVGEFTQERQAKQYEASLRRQLAERHPTLTDQQREHYEQRIAKLVEEYQQTQTQRQQQQARMPADRSQKQGRGMEIGR